MTDILTHLHDILFDVDRIPHAIAAILMTAVIGMISGPLVGTGNANPFMWIAFEKILGGMGDRLNKVKRATADLLFRGFLITGFGILLALIIGKVFEYTLTSSSYGVFWEVFFLSLMLTSGSVWFALLRLYFAMEKNDVGKGAYFAISRSTRSNLATADDFAITRTGMNFSVRSFDKGIVAPVLWYLIAGIQGAVIYSVLAALAWRFGKDGFSKGFGGVALALEKLMGFVPNALSALVITAAGLFTPTAKLHKGLASWLGVKNRAPYEEGGMPLSALAWSLNVSLGGVRQDISGSAIKGAWVGPAKATAKNDHKHLRRAIYVNVLAHIIFIAFLLSMYMWAGVLGGAELKHIKL